MRYFIALVLLAFSAPTLAVDFPFTYGGIPLEGLYKESANQAATCSTLYDANYQNQCFALADCRTVSSITSDKMQARCDIADGSTRLSGGTYWSYTHKYDSWYKSLISCPVNSTLNTTTYVCTPDSGYSAVNDGSGNWSVSPTGSECTAPKVYNATTGTCDDPPPPEPDPCLTDTRVIHVAVTDSQGNYTGAQNWSCENSCEYQRVLGSTHECYNLPESENPLIGYCSFDFKGTGSTCAQATIGFSEPSSTPSPISSTPQQVSDTINGPSSSSPTSSPNSLNPVSGGGSSGSPAVNNAPTGPAAEAPADAVIVAACEGCASEATQVKVHDALTDIEGLPDGEDIEDDTDPRGPADVVNALTNNSKIVGLLHFQVPAHSSECPVLTLTISFLRPEPYVFDTHCEIIAPHVSTIQAMATAAWILMAVIWILGA